MVDLVTTTPVTGNLNHFENINYKTQNREEASTKAFSKESPFEKKN
jgi:hypothetical protein